MFRNKDNKLFEKIDADLSWLLFLKKSTCFNQHVVHVATIVTICLYQHTHMQTLPNGKILDWFKLKAFADEKINVGEIMISFSDRTENIVGKGENAGYQYFILFPQCF